MQIISLILDGLILILLGTTVFFAGRLSLALKSFRESKDEFGRLLGQLNHATNQAEQSIHALRQASDETGHEIQLRISKSKSMSEELQLMNEAATNLADRLENYATRNREIMTRIERASGIGGEALDLGNNVSKSDSAKKSSQSSIKPDEKGSMGGGFAIRDADMDRMQSSSSRSASQASKDDVDSDFYNDDDHDSSQYMSQAEKDLARALKRTGR